MLKKISYILFILFLFSAASSGAQVISLDDFIKAAIKTNPSYQISAKEYLIALEENKNAKSIEDWNLIASGLYQDSNPAPISGFSANYQRILGYTIGAEKYFVPTGTAFKIEHANNRIYAEYPPGFEIPGVGQIDFNPQSPYYLSSLSLSITQPLLNNAFGLASKKGLEMSDYALKVSEIKLSEDWEDFISMLREEYLTWQSCQRNVDLVENKVKKVEDQLAHVKKQLKYGLSENLDLVQIRQKNEAYKLLLATAHMACETQRDKILKIMGKEALASSALSPEKLKKEGAVLIEKEAQDYLLKDSNIKKTADLLVDIQRSDLEIKEDAKNLSVNLTAQANPNAYTHGLSESVEKIGEYNEYTIMLNASRPFCNTQAETAAEKAKLAYERSLKQKDEILLNARSGLAALYTNLKYLDQMLELSQSNLKLAQERLSLEKKKFDQGRNSIFFVLQAEDDLLQAESSFNETVFTREKIINQIKSLTDQYLVEYEAALKL